MLTNEIAAAMSTTSRISTTFCPACLSELYTRCARTPSARTWKSSVSSSVIAHTSPSQEMDLSTLPPVTRSTPAIIPEIASAGPERTMMPSSREATACLREEARQFVLNMLDLPFVGADAQFSTYLLEDGVFLAAEPDHRGDLAQWHPPLMQAHDDVFRFCC